MPSSHNFHPFWEGLLKQSAWVFNATCAQDYYFKGYKAGCYGCWRLKLSGLIPLSNPSTSCGNEAWRLGMLHKSSYRARGPGKGSWKWADEKMHHPVRKRQLGWSNLGGLVKERNVPLKRGNNKGSGLPFQLSFNVHDSKSGTVIDTYQPSGNSGIKWHSSTRASNPKGREDGNSAATVCFSRQSSASLRRTSELLVYYLQQRWKNKPQKNPFSLDSILLSWEENLQLHLFS